MTSLLEWFQDYGVEADPADAMFHPSTGASSSVRKTVGLAWLGLTCGWPYTDEQIRSAAEERQFAPPFVGPPSVSFSLPCVFSLWFGCSTVSAYLMFCFVPFKTGPFCLNTVLRYGNYQWDFVRMYPIQLKDRGNL